MISEILKKMYVKLMHSEFLPRQYRSVATELKHYQTYKEACVTDDENPKIKNSVSPRTIFDLLQSHVQKKQQRMS